MEPVLVLFKEDDEWLAGVLDLGGAAPVIGEGKAGDGSLVVIVKAILEDPTLDRSGTEDRRCGLSDFGASFGPAWFSMRVSDVILPDPSSSGFS